MKTVFTLRKLGLFLLSLIFTVQLNANIAYVSEDGHDANTGTSPEDAFATIGQAIAMVESNGIVIISGRIKLQENLTLNNVTNIILMGHDNTTDIIDGQELYSIDIQRSTLSFLNIGFENGYANIDEEGLGVTEGGMLYIRVTSSVDIQYCRFENNLAQNRGGAIAVFNNSTIQIKKTDIINNEGQKGGAICVNASNIIAEKCNIIENNSREGGGGIFLEDGYGIISYCTFKENIATGQGGAIYTFKGRDVTIKGCLFQNNTGSEAGALFLNLRDDVSNITKIINCTGIGNQGKKAGFLYLYDVCGYGSETYIVNSTIVDNKITDVTPANNGSGIHIYKGTTSNDQVLHIWNSILQGNTNGNDEFCDITVTKGGDFDPFGTIDIQNSIINTLYGSQEKSEEDEVELGYTLTNSIIAQNEEESNIAKLDPAGINEYGFIPVEMPEEDEIGAYNFGNAALLRDSFDIYIDQHGKIRPYEDDKCFAGASEYTVGEEIEDIIIPDEMEDITVPSSIHLSAGETAEVTDDNVMELFIEHGATLTYNSNFTVYTTATYARTFEKGDRWYAVSFPFVVNKITDEDGEALVPLTDENEDGDYKLKYYNTITSDFVNESVPMLLRRSGYVFYVPEKWENKEIRFVSSQGVTIRTHGNDPVTPAYGYTPYGNDVMWTLEGIENAWVLDEEGEKFVKLADGTTYDLLPFESVMIGNEEADEELWIDGKPITDALNSTNKDQALEIVSAPQALVLSSQTPVNVKIYDVTGVLVRELAVDNTEIRVSLPQGIYIVNGQKAIVF